VYRIVTRRDILPPLFRRVQYGMAAALGCSAGPLIFQIGSRTVSRKMSPLVSIVIPAWNKDANASALCDAAIRSIAREVHAAYELIVVDNDSPVKGFRTSLGAVPDGSVVELQRNVGFGPAVNAGFSRAKAPFLCQMNSDCELVEDSVSLLIETMQKHELSVGMPEHYENCLHYGLGKSDQLMGPDWRFGAFWVITRRAWDLVGGFDESFRMCYWEDSDLWKRIEACGGRIAGWRGTWVKHLGGASTHPDRDKYFEENRARFLSRWGAAAPGQPCPIARDAANDSNLSQERSYLPPGTTCDSSDQRSAAAVGGNPAAQLGVGQTESSYSLYLSLLKNVLTRTMFIDNPQARNLRTKGLDWPGDAETMIGNERLDNIQQLIESIHVNKTPGDVMECGAWKGGATILMRAVLRALGVTNRIVWIADSFQGLPQPNPEQYPADAGDPHHTYSFLAVSQEQVKANFARYGLLDDQVHFIPGFFKDSLPGPVEQLALLRVDADMYESTMQALDALYPRISRGGYLIVDDYYNIANCHQAVEDYRARHKVAAPIERVDWSAVFWKKE
jgi:O-methyltransferase